MNDEARDRLLARAIAAAFPDRVAVRSSADPARATMVGGRGIELEPSSVVRRAPCFVAIDPREARAPSGAVSVRVSLASEVDPAILAELFPHLSERRVEHVFDERRGRVVARERRLHADLPLEERVGPPRDREAAAEALVAHLAARPGGLPAWVLEEEAAAGLVARVGLLARAMPELRMPDLAADGSEALSGIARRAARGADAPEAARRRLRDAILEELDPRQRAALDREAPESLVVPSGGRIRLEYAPGVAPALSVRMQEMFGCAETPRIAGGRVRVRLHLLAPNHRPVQITEDLANFWKTVYHEVRKELRAKYPKHPWPENPLEAPPRAVGRRRG